MKLFRASALALVFLGAPLMATAQDTLQLPQGNIGVFGAFTVSAPDGLEGGHGFGVAATYFFTDSIGVEGGFRRQAFDLNATDENNLRGGVLNASVVTGNVVFRFDAGRIRPYGTAGIAFYLADLAIDSTQVTQFERFGFRLGDRVENTLGFNFGGGVEFPATERLGIFVEGRFFIANTETNGELIDISTEISGLTTGEQAVNYVAINGGIRIFF